MSDSLCSMPYEEGGDEECSMWKEKWLTTSKSHQCCECGVDIPVKERVGKATGVYGGEWMIYYRCASCMILAEMVATANELCPLWGGLDESRDYLDPDMPSPREFRKKWEAS